MALVLVLGLTGAAFAAWTDDLTIEGTVNTGSVDLNVVRLSETLVYKDLDTDGLVVCHRFTNVGPPTGGLGAHQWVTPPVPTNGLLVASAQASMSDDDEVTVTFDNLFPVIDNVWWYDFIVDILCHYDGSVPAKVNSIDNFVLNPDPGTDPNLLALLPHARSMCRCTKDGMPLDEQGNVLPLEDLIHADFIELGDQLEYCDYVLILIGVDVPQDNTLMNLSGSFSCDLGVVQWNEYIPGP